MLTKRDILNYLNNMNSQLLTTKQIATHFNVTPRTIQNYLKDIKEEYKDLIEISNKGIIVSDKLNLQQDIPVPLNYKERKSYILRKLLINNTSVDLSILADELCISEVTLQNEIKRIRRSIEPYVLTLKTKNNQLFITGSTKNKKRLMIQLIYNEADNSLVSLTTLNDIFQNYDASKIRKIIIQKLNEKHFFIDEYSLINLLLHILIAMDQSPSLHNIQYEEVNADFIELNRHFVSIIDDLCHSLEELYQVQFSSSNRYQFTLLLMTRAIRNKEINEIETAKLSVSKDIINLVQIIVDQIYKTFNINLNINEFIIAFAIHIKNMLIRLKENVSIHNPLLYSIKLTSPFIYDIAVYICNIISKQQNVEVYDDEVAYIALHIGARIEELNNTREKLKVTLVCPQYYSYYNNQLKKIESYFHDSILIESIVTNPSELTPKNNDLIISTIPITDISNSVIISNFFNDNDKERISERIKHIKKKYAKETITRTLKKLFHKDLFIVNATFDCKKDAINKMGKHLIDKGYVSKTFIDKMLERENISPTNFGMIAIPHPIDYYAKKTVIEVAILKQPILWGNTSIKIIFMFSISKLDFSSFSDVFSFLASTCSDDNNLDSLVKCTSYSEFMSTILNLYSL